MLHLFIADNFETLKEMLQAQTDTAKFNSREENVLYGENIWVIHVIGYRKHRIFMNALKKSPIAFDSAQIRFSEASTLIQKIRHLSPMQNFSSPLVDRCVRNEVLSIGREAVLVHALWNRVAV